MFVKVLIDGPWFDSFCHLTCLPSTKHGWINGEINISLRVIGEYKDVYQSMWKFDIREFVTVGCERTFFSIWLKWKIFNFYKWNEEKI